MKWISLGLLLIGSTNFICAQSNESILNQNNHVISFEEYPTIDAGYYPGKLNMEAWRLGFYAFNYAPELIPLFADLKKNFNIQCAVETGTFRGGTTVAFSLLFDEVYTIEINEDTYVDSKKRLDEFSNTQCLFGSSEKVISELLPSLQDKRTLFYLDAHWNAHWPLLLELEEIGKTHKDNCIVVIDDFKVPGRWDIGYDYYATSDKINECSFEYIHSTLKNVFSAYSVYYIIPKNKVSRAKVVIVPQAWLNSAN